MSHVLLLGSGLVGKTIAVDLATNHQVTVIDTSNANLASLPQNENIHPINQDATNIPNIEKYINNSDLIVGALPGHLGFSTLKKIIPYGKPIVDISFFPEDPFELDTLAKQYNIPFAMDCGLAPGMSNIICGYSSTKMNIERFKCMVGGLPQEPKWPFKYKAVFSPMDVIEEYTRPARFVQDGKRVIKDALTDVETFRVKGVGELEAFNTDGLRTLLKTMSIPNMVEKTIRYSGTTQYLQFLKEVGYFSNKSHSVGNSDIKPIDLTSKLVLPHWEMKPEDRDVTILKIEIDGATDNKQVHIEYDLIDKYDTETHTTSMARTTGYTCTAIVNYILNGSWKKIGLCPPEEFGKDEDAFNYILTYLSDHGVHYIKSS